MIQIQEHIDCKTMQGTLTTERIENLPLWSEHTWPNDPNWRCYNCWEYGMLDKNDRILVPCVNCARVGFLGGSQWRWFGVVTYGSWDGESENSLEDVMGTFDDQDYTWLAQYESLEDEWDDSLKYLQHVSTEEIPLENDTMNNTYSEGSQTLESLNTCVECGVDMGHCNPRQLCGKTYCKN